MKSKIKCIVIDDENPAIEVLKNYIQRIPELELVSCFNNPIEGLKEIKRQNIDLVFLDIQMDELSGIEVMNIIDEDVKVILCTAYSEFALEGFNLNAVDYLLKPINFERFSKSIDKLKKNYFFDNKIDNSESDYFFIKTEQKGKIIKIKFSEIDYIESLGNYVIFHLEEQKVTAYTSMKNLEEILPKNQFKRIHKSYIINSFKIGMIENGFVLINNSIGKNLKLSIGNNYKDKIMNELKKKLL